MARPSTLPVWAVSGDKVTPSGAKQDTGWEKILTVDGLRPEKPPYEYFNWWQNLTYEWLLYWSDLTDDEFTQIKNIDSTTISSAQWGYVGNLDQDLRTTDTVQFNEVLTTRVDRASVGILKIADLNASAVEISKSGDTTTVKGGLIINQLLTAGANGNTHTINSNIDLDSSTATALCYRQNGTQRAKTAYNNATGAFEITTDTGVLDFYEISNLVARYLSNTWTFAKAATVGENVVVNGSVRIGKSTAFSGAETASFICKEGSTSLMEMKWQPAGNIMELRNFIAGPMDFYTSNLKRGSIEAAGNFVHEYYTQLGASVDSGDNTPPLSVKSFYVASLTNANSTDLTHNLSVDRIKMLHGSYVNVGLGYRIPLTTESTSTSRVYIEYISSTVIRVRNDTGATVEDIYLYVFYEAS